MMISRIVFHVQDAAATPIAGALISAESPNGHWQGLTEVSGDFVAFLTAGHYDLTITAAGYRTRTLPADLADPGTVTIGLDRLVPLLHVEGLHFFTEHDEPWRMAFVSSFRLYERFLRGGDIRPLLQEAIDVGANGVRVFGAFDFGSPDVQRLYPHEHADYFTRIPEFFALLASYQLWCEWTAFADTARSVPDQYAHWAQLCDALRPIPNVLLERVNENDANDNRVVDDLPAPTGILCSYGSNGAGNNPPLGPWGDYAALHSERSTEIQKLQQSSTTLTYAINGSLNFGGTHRATVNNEPPGFADNDIPGKRTSDPWTAYLLGLGCQWGAGGTAHSDNGVQSVLLSGTQRACVEAFLRGVRA